MTVNPYQRGLFENRGFHFFELFQVNNSYTVRLTVNASLGLNNTVLHCNGVLDGDNTHKAKSTKATLLVVEGEIRMRIICSSLMM